MRLAQCRRGFGAIGEELRQTNSAQTTAKRTDHLTTAVTQLRFHDDFNSAVESSATAILMT